MTSVRMRGAASDRYVRDAPWDLCNNLTIAIAESAAELQPAVGAGTLEDERGWSRVRS